MKGFPAHLTPSNLSQFSKHKFNRQLCYTRRHVYECMMQPNFGTINEQDKSMNCGINLNDVKMGEFESRYKIDERITQQICSELKDLGWEITVSYGGTMLFVCLPGYKPAGAVACQGFE